MHGADRAETDGQELLETRPGPWWRVPRLSFSPQQGRTRKKILPQEIKFH